ncbi:hypothetical protein Dimus_034722 [Dionaea muscipula]
MRNLASCYSEHAVRVSDSYCSGPLNKSCVSPPKLSPSIPNAVSFTYKTNLSSQRHLLITITWSLKLICQGFWIRISEKMPSAFIRNCPNPLQLSMIKGTEKFESCNSKIELHWDLSNAKFDSGHQPTSSFYIVVLVDSDLGLILGDMEAKPEVKNVIVGFPIAKFLLVSQCEDFSGNKNQQFSTKARFCDSGVAHNMLVRFDEEDEGVKSPILSVLIDNKRVVKITRLKWNFRGSEVAFVDRVAVDVMWDIHGWLFDHGNAVIMFRRRELDSRLWLWVEDKDLAAEMNHDNVEFSLVICARNNTG